MSNVYITFINMDLDFISNNFHRFKIIFSNKLVNFDHLAKGCQPGSWVMAEFSRFIPEEPEEEIKVDGDSVKLSADR